MKALALAISLAACSPAQRATTLALTSTALLGADWYQTRSGITASCREQNPVIGKCGENVSPDVYFPVVIATHLVVGLALRKDWRTMWFSTLAGAQGSTVWSNWRRK